MTQPAVSRTSALAADPAQLYRYQVRDLEDFALFVMAPDGRLITWNRGVEKAFGYSEPEWIGQHCSVIFTPEDRQAGIVEAEMGTAAEHGRSVDVRWHLRKDGVRVYMTGVLQSLRDDDGAIVGYSKSVLDETARKQLEDALTESNVNLQQFAYVASHDLQEPLRTISQLAQLLNTRFENHLDDQVRQVLQFMVDAASRMGLLIRDLLDYAQIVNEPAELMPVFLDAELESAISLLRGTIETTGAAITHDPLPSITLSRAPMVRVFQNLLSNALKYRRPNVAPRVHVSAEQRGDDWIIRVADNGIGFPPDQADAIFAPFKRLHTSRQYPGSGIGLAACKRIIEGFGGRIGAESTPGNGATFWFSVPTGKS